MTVEATQSIPRSHQVYPKETIPIIGANGIIGYSNQVVGDVSGGDQVVTFSYNFPSVNAKKLWRLNSIWAELEGVGGNVNGGIWLRYWPILSVGSDFVFQRNRGLFMRLVSSNINYPDGPFDDWYSFWWYAPSSGWDIRLVVANVNLATLRFRVLVQYIDLIMLS